MTDQTMPQAAFNRGEHYDLKQLPQALVNKPGIRYFATFLSKLDKSFVKEDVLNEFGKVMASETQSIVDDAYAMQYTEDLYNEFIKDKNILLANNETLTLDEMKNIVYIWRGPSVNDIVFGLPQGEPEKPRNIPEQLNKLQTPKHVSEMSDDEVELILSKLDKLEIESVKKALSELGLSMDEYKALLVRHESANKDRKAA